MGEFRADDANHADFNPDQPRDEHGRFGAGGGGSAPKEGGDKAARGGGASRVVGARTWTDKVPEGMTKETWQAHYSGDPSKGGKPSAERAHDVHEPIMREALNVPPAAPGEQKVAIMTMGAPASGKSSALRGVDTSKFVKVDPDDIKTKLPEYQQATADKDNTYRGAAAMAHEESSDVAKRIMAQGIANGNHLIIDGTGSDAGKFIAKMNQLKAAGYHVHVTMPHVEEEEGISRLKSRAESTGRMVPEKFARDAYKSIPSNFEKIAHQADSFKLYDNGGAAPRIVYQGSKSGVGLSSQVGKLMEKHGSGGEVVHDRAFMDRFHALHPRKDAADIADGERVIRFDASKITSTKTGPSGGLIVNGNLRRTGVLTYRMADGSSRKELCHPDEVFHKDSMESFHGAPVTEGHPGKVSPANWKDHAVGTMHEAPTRNGDFLSGPLHVADSKTIGKVKKGDLKEISCGYECSLDHTPGEWKGEKYDAIQRRVRGNHVALGPSGWGRAGSEVALKMDGWERSGVAYAEDATEDATFDDMTEEEKKALAQKAADEKARADKLEAEIVQLRADQAAAKTDKERTDAMAKELEVVKDKSKLLEQQLARHDEAKVTRESASVVQARADELVSLREQARSVFACATDPKGEKWKADGKDAATIRREVLAHLNPKFAFKRADGTDILEESLVMAYDLEVAHKQRTDGARAGALSATQPRADGKKPGDPAEEMPGMEGDEDMPKNARDARKQMVKDYSARYESANDRSNRMNNMRSMPRDAKGAR